MAKKPIRIIYSNRISNLKRRHKNRKPYFDKYLESKDGINISKGIAFVSEIETEEEYKQFLVNKFDTNDPVTISILSGIFRAYNKNSEFFIFVDEKYVAQARVLKRFIESNGATL